MPSTYEQGYIDIVESILRNGQSRVGRNGGTLSLFTTVLDIPHRHDNFFPLLEGREMKPRGVFGEFAALIRQPKHLADFERFSCNYWKLWAKPNGDIDIDYGNQWYNFCGYDQVQALIDGIIKDPAGRRHIINSWRPDRLDVVDLPCCHFMYQWYIRGDYIDMMWYQRSADFMIGVPSDAILAQLFNICVAHETGYKPGNIKMIFGDSHIYSEHVDQAWHYIDGARSLPFNHGVAYIPDNLTVPLTGDDSQKFMPYNIRLRDYCPLPAINFELKK